MKKYITLLSTCLLSIATGFAQTTSSANLVSATILPGSQPNSVYIAFKSSADITLSRFSTFQFAIGIPATISPAPTATVVSSDPLMSYSAPQVSTETQNSVNYTVYGFSGDGAQSGAGILYSANTAYNYAEVFFTGTTVATTDVRLMQLANGGTTTNVNFYVADRGFDITNQNAQFYSATVPNFSNDGQGYSGSSFAIVSSIVVPVKFTGFSVVKKADDALLSWGAVNENTAGATYEVERSLTGSDFTTIATVPVKGNSASNTYSYSDDNLSLLGSAGTVYYRIEQDDKDGKPTYTDIKTVTLADGVSISAFPNPTKDNVFVSVNLLSASTVSIGLTDASGKQLQQFQVAGAKGTNTKTISLAGYAPGSYLVKVTSGSGTTTLPVVKQ